MFTIDENRVSDASYHIVIIDVINLLVYYGRPPTTMHAVLATIFDGGWAIHQKLE